MGGHRKFMYEALKWTVPKQIALNRTIWSQTKACFVQMACVDKEIKEYD